MHTCLRVTNLLTRKKCFQASLTAVEFYSRRSNSKNPDVYKVVGSEAVGEYKNAFASSPNWELLMPPGYRFYLPGGVGPAWQNTATTLNLDDLQVTLSFQKNRGKAIVITNIAATMECVAQECPMLLRQGVLEMFPGLASPGMQLTVVTLIQKMRGADVEELSKQFILAARDICSKLKQAGYAADFVNPFSGRPFVGAFQNQVGDVPKEFACLALRINKQANCQVIMEHKNNREFVGSLFTNAPASMLFLQEVLDQ
ncbi:cobalamin trafficking protein CblD-like [Bacillus rossius redtenbacheri]|uniref:cobalamin trafficking protein CblD-like n=1 Tax=Bacillus rossius redtenbacheri TaxID=93214 RepID=UPI002FDE14B4